MSNPNHEFPDGPGPQGPGQTPHTSNTAAPMQYPPQSASDSANTAYTAPWQSQNPHMIWYPSPPQGTAQNYQQPGQLPRSVSRRRVEDLFLNVLLYLGSLLLIGSAALLITSITSEDLGSIILRVAAIGFGSLLFYATGLITYKTVKRLRLASYSFTATGLALLPLTGIAAYVLGLCDNGSMIWLLTSLVGTAAIILACSFMRNRVMAYVLISFFVSDALAVTHVATLPFVWYFVALTVLATLLGLLLHLNPRLVPAGLREGLLESSRVFVPVTALVVFFFVPQMSYTDLGIVFAIMSIHAFVFTILQKKLDYYVQARIYPLLALLYLGLDLSVPARMSVILLGIYAVQLLAAAVGYPLMQRSMQENPPRHFWMHWDAQVDIYLSAIFSILVTLYSANAIRPSVPRPVPDGLEFMPFIQLEGIFTPRPWVFAVLCLSALVIYRMYLSAQEYVYLLITSGAVLSIVLLERHNSAFYLYFITAILLVLTTRGLQLPQLLTTTATKVFLFLGVLHLLYTLNLGWGARGNLIMGALFVCSLGLFTALRYEMMPQKRSLAAFREALVYLSLAVLFFMLRSMLSWGPQTMAPVLDTVLYTIALLAILSLGFLVLRAASAYMNENAIPLTCIYLVLGSLCIATPSMTSPYYLPQGEWWIVGILLLTSLYMFGLSYIIPRDSSTRRMMHMTARFPMLWSIIVLWASRALTGDHAWLILSLFLLVQGVISGVLYRTRQSQLERNAFYSFFYVSCFPGFVVPLFYTENALLTALVCPAVVLILWGLGEWLKLTMLRICASVALLLTGYTLTCHLLAGQYVRIWDYPLYLGLAAALSGAVLYGLCVVLPREIPGKNITQRPSINLRLPNGYAIPLPMHGPLPSPRGYMAPQHRDSTRFYGPQNISLMGAVFVALMLWALASLGSQDVTISALIWALVPLSFASMSTKNSLPAALITAPIAFIARVLFSGTNFFQGFVEVIILVLLAISASQVLKNLINKRPAREGVTTALLYTALGLQAFLTLLIWAGGAHLSQSLIVLVLGVFLTVLASVVLDRIWVYICAALVTVELAIMLNGLNPITLMIISLVLITGVVWRLLARDQAPTEAHMQQNMPQNLPPNPAGGYMAPQNGSVAPQTPWSGQQPSGYTGYPQQNMQETNPGYSQPPYNSYGYNPHGDVQS